MCQDFVINGELHASTQYYPSCFVPEFVAKKQQIQEKLLEYWRMVAPRIKTPNYTIDIALAPDLSRAWLVELNGPVRAYAYARVTPSRLLDAGLMVCARYSHPALEAASSTGRSSTTATSCSMDLTSCASSSPTYVAWHSARYDGT